MINFKKTLGCICSVTLLSVALPAMAATRQLSNDEYSDVIASILLKNKIITEKSQVSQVVLEKTVASLADDLTNINNHGNLIFDRAVQFNVDLTETESQFRSYTCNLTVKIKGQNDFSGSRLNSCEFHARGLEMLTY